MIFLNENMNIKKSLETTVFKETKFTKENKQAVFAKITQKRRDNHILPMLVSCLFVVIMGSIGVYYGKELFFGENSHVSMGGDQPTDLQPVKGDGNQPTDLQPVEGDGNQLFELTELEKLVYNKFKINLDPKELLNIEPISIAKLYVYADYHQEYEVKYALYTDREGSIMWSAEEDKNIPISHRENQEQIIERFKNIDKGTFIQTDENGGYIEFNRTGNDEGISGFSMVKNENGIWQVAFMPTQ